VLSYPVTDPNAVAVIASELRDLARKASGCWMTANIISDQVNLSLERALKNDSSRSLTSIRTELFVFLTKDEYPTMLLRVVFHPVYGFYLEVSLSLEANK
jgi:hypothetical protein